MTKALKNNKYSVPRKIFRPLHGTSTVQNSAPLSWSQRHNVALGTARGLQFLHTIKDKPLIHGDIKSANILLDANWEPRIGDFGLAREGPQSQYSHMKVSRVHGTRPYLPDEFLRSKQLSTKVDTYSFGIVLFELATGFRAFDDARPKGKKLLREHVIEAKEDLSLLLDKRPPISGTLGIQVFVELLALGRKCSQSKAKERPEMVTVLRELENMAAQRDIANRAQSLVQEPRLSPANPYEAQVMYDLQISQQKWHTPAADMQWNGAGCASPRLQQGSRQSIKPLTVIIPSNQPHRLTPYAHQSNLAQQQSSKLSPNPQKLSPSTPSIGLTPDQSLSPPAQFTQQTNLSVSPSPQQRLSPNPPSFSPHPSNMLPLSVSPLPLNTTESAPLALQIMAPTKDQECSSGSNYSSDIPSMPESENLSMNSMMLPATILHVEQQDQELGAVSSNLIPFISELGVKDETKTEEALSSGTPMTPTDPHSNVLPVVSILEESTGDQRSLSGGSYSAEQSTPTTVHEVCAVYHCTH